MKKDLAEQYLTRDLAEAAALVALGQKLVRLHPAGRHYYFCFADHPTCIRLSADYWAGRLRIDPYRYSVYLRSLKDRVHVGR